MINRETLSLYTEYAQYCHPKFESRTIGFPLCDNIMLRTLSSSLHTCIAAAPRYTATRVAILDSSICSLTRTFGNANANGSKADFDKIVSIYRPEIKPEWQTLPKVLLDVRSDGM